MRLKDLAGGIVLSAAVMAFAGPGALAQNAKGESAATPLRIGIIDVSEVKRRVAMTRDVFAKMDELRKSFRIEIQTEEKSLQKANEELNRQRVLLSPDAFEAERKKFETRVQQIQGKVRASGALLNKIRGVGDRAFQQQLIKAVIGIANAQNLTLVLNKREIILTASAYEITKQVIADINKNMPRYEVPKEILNPGK